MAFTESIVEDAALPRTPKGIASGVLPGLSGELRVPSAGKSVNHTA
jgi:hypothetical protein